MLSGGILSFVCQLIRTSDKDAALLPSFIIVRSNSILELFKYLCILHEILHICSPNIPEVYISKEYLCHFVIACQTSPVMLILWTSAVVTCSSGRLTGSPNGSLLLTPRVVWDGCPMWGSACVEDGSIYWLISCYTFSLINANLLLSHVTERTGFIFCSGCQLCYILLLIWPLTLIV